MGIPAREIVHPFEDRLRRALQDEDLCLLFNKRRGFWQVAVFTHNVRNLPVRLTGAELCEDPKIPVPFWWVADSLRVKRVSMPAGGLVIPNMNKPGDKPYEPISPGEWMIKPLYDSSQRTREDITNRDARYDPKAFFDFLQANNEERDAEIERKEDQDYMDETIPEARHWLAGRVISYG